MAMMDEKQAEALRQRFLEVSGRVRAAARASGRQEDAVALVAVSKTHPAEAVAVLAGMGQTLFGESYVQEALAKQEAVNSLVTSLAGGNAGQQVQWHFIGHLQSKKAKDVVGKFSLIHAVDSLKLAQNMQNRLAMLPVTQTGAPAGVQDVLIQVNIGREAQKSGVAIEDAASLAEAVAQMPLLRLQGFMCMPPFHCTGDMATPFFAHLRTIRDDVERRLGLTLPHLSMGMSHDFEQAIGQGATLVRVGTDIFGTRDV